MFSATRLFGYDVQQKKEFISPEDMRYQEP